ncbi:valine--pyruvate transaminase [Priestia endophytica]|uniref:Valine--pyruvate transaminase n=1 Tax=Priestia endophytica TaxID=135735 RepID=A0AAX1Q6S9_9BACI|nr:valine--pyruvate transaminase [Priestia endophytica]RAS75985.1 valine--pyruvate transaminase [Priestia endophytica]RAS92191.1 valine--pyruvate transaminase [Priestia endophytica]
MSDLKLSKIGQKMMNKVGVRAIMHDIQEVLNSDPSKYINLSAGNPTLLPEVYKMWEDSLRNILSNGELENMVSKYGSSYGTYELIDCIREYFYNNYDVKLERENILITSGSQNLFFLALNSFCGPNDKNNLKHALIPMLPDYAGYSGVALEKNIIEGIPPLISKIDNHTFRYELDRNSFLERVMDNRDIGAMVLSRPNNPCGNVLSEREILFISNVCSELNIPLLIDSAYAPPFPAINFVDMNPILTDNIVHCMSVSKAGLPGERIGIAIGKPQYIKVMEAFQSNISIHSSRLGQKMVADSLQNGQLPFISVKYIREHYKQKYLTLKKALTIFMPDDIPWFLHCAEGSLFSWLWLENLPLEDKEFYNKLKEQNLIVVPGNSFFHDSYAVSMHARECIRISLTATDDDIMRGIEILSNVTKECYKESISISTS